MVVGVSMIGAGYWGRNLLRNLQAADEVSLLSLCDTDEGKARRLLGEYSTVPVCGSIDAVLEDSRVDAVVIATPVATHCDLALAAIEAGKHVLVEKPLAASASDGAKMVQAAKDNGVVLMVDHTFCYAPAVRRLAAMVRGGELGEIQYIDSVRTNLGIVQPDVDVLWDLGPHDLSILEAVLPPDVRPAAVSAVVSTPSHLGRPASVHMSVRLSNGAIAHAYESWLSPVKSRRMVIGGSRRIAVWNDVDPVQPLVVYDRGVDPAGPDTGAPASYRSGDAVSLALPGDEPLHTMIGEFVDAIAHGCNPRTDGEAGLRVLRQLEAASVSHASDGGFVTLAAGEGDQW
ncbi:Gfo/Idh/MocA family oxidoreductase [Tomitella gaofuii]|uniref:Gfo/Idh/MocA family protein n=1 Tax=Tomitella gaofuii TaxID=2760083 RepID=UPI002E295A25|nr:Gfo/Idh/MocA family oxidoreductase [Tomitella gaofuii]